jgi:hypothetical protein
MASIHFANTGVLFGGMILLIVMLATTVLPYWVRSFPQFLVTVQCGAAAVCVVMAFSGPEVTMRAPTVQPATWNITGVIDDSGSVSPCLPRNDDEASLLAMPSCSEDSIFTGFSIARDAFVAMAVHRDQDHFAAIVLGDDSVIVSRHGGDESPTEKTIAGLLNIKPRFGGTNITASLHDAVNDLKSVPANRILIITTDGEDEIKSKDHKELVADIIQYNIKVYWLCIQRPGIAPNPVGDVSLPYLIDAAQGTRLTVKSQAGAYEAVKEISWQLGQGTEGKTVSITQDVSGYFGVLAAITVCFAFCGCVTVVSMSRKAKAQQATVISDPTPELGLKPAAGWPASQSGPDRDGPVSLE